MTVPVLHRQTPACKRHHLPAMSQVEIIEWCPAEHVLRVAGFRATRVPASTPHPSRPSKIGPMPQYPLSHLCTTEWTAQGRRERLQTQAQMGHHAYCPLHCCPQMVQPAHRGHHSARHAGRCSPGSAWTGLSPIKGIRRGGQPKRQAALRAGGALEQSAVTPFCRETAPGASS